MFDGITEILNAASELEALNFIMVIVLMVIVGVLWNARYKAIDELRSDEFIQSQLNLIRDSIVMTDKVNEAFQAGIVRLSQRIDHMADRHDNLIVQINKLDLTVQANVRAIASTREGVNELKDVVQSVEGRVLKQVVSMNDNLLKTINATALGAVKTSLHHQETALNETAQELTALLNQIQEHSSTTQVTMAELGQMMGTILRAIESIRDGQNYQTRQLESLQLLVRVEKKSQEVQAVSVNGESNDET